MDSGKIAVATTSAILAVLLISLGVFSLGESRGHAQGRIEGKLEGYTQGKDEGYKTGHKAGLEEGKALGYIDGEKAGDAKGYNRGKNESNDQEYNRGYAVGKSDGKNEGYNLGAAETAQKILSANYAQLGSWAECRNCWWNWYQNNKQLNWPDSPSCDFHSPQWSPGCGCGH